MEWEKEKSTAKVLDELKSQRYKIFAIEQGKKSIPYYKLKTSAKGGSTSGGKTFNKIALILGSEVRGLPASVLNRVDKILEIPMAGRKESLNVAVAFGIVAFGLKYR